MSIFESLTSLRNLKEGRGPLPFLRGRAGLVLEAGKLGNACRYEGGQVLHPGSVACTCLEQGNLMLSC